MVCGCRLLLITQIRGGQGDEHPEADKDPDVTYLTTLFGHDYERLMTPAAPFIYLFTAALIQKFFPQDNSKFVKLGLIYFLIIFVGNFYHLWGIFILPDRIYSLAMAITSAIAMGILFFHFQLKKR